MTDFTFIPYDEAHVPLQEGSPHPVTAPREIVMSGTRSIEGPPGAEQRILHEQTGYSGGDYRPGKTKIEKIIQSRTPKAKPQRIVVVPGDVDYYTPEQSAKIREARGAKIKEIAKEIIDQKAKMILAYNKAKKLVEAAKKEDLSNPSEELSAAIKIVKKGAPLTKEKALELAEEQLAARTHIK